MRRTASSAEPLSASSIAALNCFSSVSTSCPSYMVREYLPTTVVDASRTPRQAIGAIANAASTGRGESAPAGVATAGEHEIRARLVSARVAIAHSIVVLIGAAAYALATWDEPNRSAILIVIGLAALSLPLIAALPIERIVRSRWREAFFVGWSGADLVLIAICAGLDGGSQSPYMLLLVLPFLFSALSYPTRGTAVVGLVALAAFFVVAFGVGGGLPLKGFGLFAGLCVALLGSWEARNQLGRREELEQTASALARSEQSSRLQADQQREVARF